MTLNELISRMHNYDRGQRKIVCMLLDAEVLDGHLSQRDADAILLDWDVDHFPEQIPKPVREYVLKNRSTRPFNGPSLHDEDD